MKVTMSGRVTVNGNKADSFDALQKALVGKTVTMRVDEAAGESRTAETIMTRTDGKIDTFKPLRRMTAQALIDEAGCGTDERNADEAIRDILRGGGWRGEYVGPDRLEDVIVVQVGPRSNEGILGPIYEVSGVQWMVPAGVFEILKDGSWIELCDADGFVVADVVNRDDTWALEYRENHEDCPF